MNARPLLLITLAAVLAGGACGTPAATDAPVGPAKTASSAPPDPHALLLQSLPSVESGSVRFAVRGTDPVTGVVDAAKRSLRIDMTQKVPDPGFTLTMSFLFVDKQSWVKIALRAAPGVTGLPKLPKAWMLLDPAKLKAGGDALPDGYAEETDPGDAGSILRAVVDVRQTAAGHFAGTTDLTEIGAGDIVAAKTLTALGARAKAVEFEATTDDRGRLRSVLVKIPAAGKTKASTYEVSYRDYGTVPSPAKPAASEQQKATATVYEMLNG